MLDTQKDNFIQIKRLSSNEDYFQNVFKKTEKLLSVIFYILSHTDKNDDLEIHIQNIKDKTLYTHEISLQTLSLQTHEIDEGLLPLQYALVGLESSLRLAGAAGVYNQAIAQLMFEQIDVVQRYLQNHFLKESTFSLSSTGSDQTALTSKNIKPAPARPRRQRVQIPAGDISSDAHFVYSQLTDRADRIKTVLEAKPKASVKDVAEIITDVSEKTIQRELNSLIEKGQVVREGERRWSTYSVIK